MRNLLLAGAAALILAGCEKAVKYEIDVNGRKAAAYAGVSDGRVYGYRVFFDGNEGVVKADTYYGKDDNHNDIPDIDRMIILCKDGTSVLIKQYRGWDVDTGLHIPSCPMPENVQQIADEIEEAVRAASTGQ